MEPVRHTVFYSSRGWMVRLRTTEVGPYASQEFAIRVAVIEAKHLKNNGAAVSLVVRDEIGKIVAEHAL